MRVGEGCRTEVIESVFALYQEGGIGAVKEALSDAVMALEVYRLDSRDAVSRMIDDARAKLIAEKSAVRHG